jgi:hypothetical protein
LQLVLRRKPQEALVILSDPMHPVVRRFLFEGAERYVTEANVACIGDGQNHGPDPVLRAGAERGPAKNEWQNDPQ